MSSSLAELSVLCRSPLSCVLRSPPQFCVLRPPLGSVSFALRSVLCSSLFARFFVLHSSLGSVFSPPVLRSFIKSTCEKYEKILRSTLILYRKYAANAYAHFRTLITRATVLPLSYIHNTSVLRLRYGNNFLTATVVILCGSFKLHLGV